MVRPREYYPKDHRFTTEEICRILDSIVGKTFGEIDIENVFEIYDKNKKNKGIIGTVIERSVLGYSCDNRQCPDILIDGVETEVKSTGLKESKGEYVAKEPMSITAISPEEIVYERFEDSHFWRKLEHLLIIYYLYNSKKKDTSDYPNFPILWYDLDHRFDDEDLDILRNDWEITKGFISDLQRMYDYPEDEYPRISSELNGRLMYLDTSSPKWPKNPRFRLKRSFVDQMVRQHKGAEMDHIRKKINRYADIDDLCHGLTERYVGMTVSELADEFCIEIKDRSKVSKSIVEQIMVRMFGGSSKKLNNIDIFTKAGLMVKSLTLSSKGGRTEDMKLFRVDFDSWTDPNAQFEESDLYDYFASHQFLFILFRESNKDGNMADNRFIGFKRLSFNSSFIEDEVRPVWDIVRDIVMNDRLMETPVLDKYGYPKLNPCGTPKTELNLPKSADHKVFLRGGGKDSTDKAEHVCGLDIYRQFVWIKGKTMVGMLENIPML